jgi:transposase
MAADETSVSETPTVARTWAIRSKTPKIKHSFNWKRLSVLIFLSACGLIFPTYEAGSFKAEKIVLALEALLRVVDGRIVLLWDGASIHTSKVVKAFLAREEVKARLEVVYLPPYCPDYNPVELVNSSLKRKFLGNFVAKKLEELKERARECARDWRQDPERIKAVFRHALGIDFSTWPVKQ